MSTTTSALETPSSSALPSGNALSTGVLAAIIIGGFALVAMAGLGIWLYQRRSRRARSSSSKRTSTARRWPRRHERYSQHLADEEKNWDAEEVDHDSKIQRESPATKREGSKTAGSERGRKEGGERREKQLKVESPEFAAISQGRGSTYEGI